MREGYETPEEAARGDIPERYAVALSVDYSNKRTKARVLLATNEAPAIEYYQAFCSFDGGRWFFDGGQNSDGPNGEWPWSA